MVKIQTEEICKIAVKKDGNMINYVKYQTEEICKLAIKKFGCFPLMYAKKELQTEKMINLLNPNFNS